MDLATKIGWLLSGKLPDLTKTISVHRVAADEAVDGGVFDSPRFRSGRLVAAMGIDLTDCDVIVARKAAFTGRDHGLTAPDDDGVDVPGGAR